MTTLLTLLLNPRTWVILLAVGVITFFAYTMDQNSKMKIEIADQQDEISELQDTAETLKAGQLIIKDDIVRLDEMAKRKQQVIIREIQIQKELDEIPKTIDAPLADPNNLLYAKRLRDYQNESLANLTRN